MKEKSLLIFRGNSIGKIIVKKTLDKNKKKEYPFNINEQI